MFSTAKFYYLLFFRSYNYDSFTEFIFHMKKVTFWTSITFHSRLVTFFFFILFWLISKNISAFSYQILVTSTTWQKSYVKRKFYHTVFIVTTICVLFTQQSCHSDLTNYELVQTNNKNILQTNFFLFFASYPSFVMSFHTLIRIIWDAIK